MEAINEGISPTEIWPDSMFPLVIDVDSRDPSATPTNSYVAKLKRTRYDSNLQPSDVQTDAYLAHPRYQD